MIFAHPYFLLLLIALGIYIFIEKKFKLNKTATIYLPQAEIYKNAGTTLKAKLSKMLVWVKVLSIALLIVALARPQSGQNIDYKELFTYFLWPALLLLLVTEFLSRTYLRKLP